MRPLLMPGRASLSKPQTFWRHPSKFGWHAWTEKMCFYWNISAWEKMSHGLMDQVGLQTRHVTVLCQQPASTLHMFLKAVYLCTSTWVCYSMRLSGSAPFMCTWRVFMSALFSLGHAAVFPMFYLSGWFVVQAVAMSQHSSFQSATGHNEPIKWIMCRVNKSVN